MKCKNKHLKGEEKKNISSGLSLPLLTQPNKPSEMLLLIMYMLLALERLAIYFETNYYGDVIQNLFVVPLDVNFYNKFSVTQPGLGFTGL